ncbi:GNAT family N-acetyltransferase [Actinoplanes sp. NBRC 101535]|uniref:GNAT family N-acetyltransferase n=1 Tax=Actinoplanes sp. NBRC 101535 TaxID=3032196 RepID=UPI0024A5FFFD|nr:GNAT family N-acetyltransferase [Actinoplanes sp. NBRC 101535]GLY01965.1 hypothetical protein Acsp01_23440 [Actinoplanes sp. NBRC 101535]
MTTVPAAAAQIDAARIDVGPIDAARIGAGPIGAGSIGACSIEAGPLDEEELTGLVRRCLAVDGGLPLAVEPGFLRSRWAAPGSVAFAVRPSTGDGRLLAALAVRPVDDGVAIIGLVDPDARGRGIGSRLLDHGLAAAGLLQSGATAAEARHGARQAGHPGPPSADAGRTAGEATGASARPPAAPATAVVRVESEGLTAGAAELFASRGFRQSFAEDVMRMDLADRDIMPPDWPAGTTTAVWSGGTAERFHAVYTAAFRDRPGFPGTPAAEWIADTEDDDDFRPEFSLLAMLPEESRDDGGDINSVDRSRDAGFVTAGVGWIVQIGVRPEARRRGLASALMRESLHRMAAAGIAHAWLCVNVDNPAASVYRRLGFVDRGRRARFLR